MLSVSTCEVRMLNVMLSVSGGEASLLVNVTVGQRQHSLRQNNLCQHLLSVSVLNVRMLSAGTLRST